MFTVIVSCLLAIATTTLIHFEILGVLSNTLPKLGVPRRSKLLAVVFVALTSNAIQIYLYGFMIYFLVSYANVGTLLGADGFSLVNCFYFSAEAYTSLGFVDIVPRGSIRLLVGAEALNGILMIGWSASYLYIAMERYWNGGE
ncbi:MAG: ion channel [Steroidobacteraceae bacterium]